MYERYALVLTVTQNCNMRCTYCYAGRKTNQTMPDTMARKTIDRAIASVDQGGTLDLGFFGGEPLLEAERIERLIAYARSRATAAGIHLALTMTTNGTITHARAWSIMTQPDLSLAISFDGLPAVHDRHRRFRNGRGTADIVQGTIRRLVGSDKPFRVVMVVRPDTLEHLPESLLYLRRLGVRRIEPSLDVWATRTEADIDRLEAIVADAATIWRDGLPQWSVGWFDQKAVELARLPRKRPQRCGFGDGELTVAPSGRMYPCERLVGDDVADDPMALPGDVMDGEDFVDMPKSPGRTDEACGACAMVGMCNTFCRCSNYVRTGDVRRPDALLCRWNQACLTETARVLREAAPADSGDRMNINVPACTSA